MSTLLDWLTGSWKARAACTGEDPDWWFADRSNGLADLAIEVCSRCPVASDCWQDARQHQETHGIRAGQHMPEFQYHWNRLVPCGWCGRETFADAGRGRGGYCSRACRRNHRQAAGLYVGEYVGEAV